LTNLVYFPLNLEIVWGMKKIKFENSVTEILRNETSDY